MFPKRKTKGNKNFIEKQKKNTKTKTKTSKPTNKAKTSTQLRRIAPKNYHFGCQQ